MKNTLTYLIPILDRSGSMGQGKQNTMNGYNAFMEKQAQVPGECLVTLVQFDDVYEQVYVDRPVAQAPKLTDENYQPRGSTALLGAIGKTIHELGHRLELMKEEDRPGKVIVVIITDGLENASGQLDWSRGYTREGLKHTIEHQTRHYSWQFVFIGANQNALFSAEEIGIARSHAINYTHNYEGTQSLYADLGDNVAAFREGTARSMSWSANQHENQRKAKGTSKLKKETAV